MDLPDEELQQPLVEPPQHGTPARSPQHAGVSPKRALKPKEMLRAPGLAGPKQAITSNYVAMQNAPDTGDEEEKEDAQRARHEGKQQLPYAAPNVHPYAVPQYQPRIYGGGAHDGSAGSGGGWGASHDPSYSDTRGSNIDIAVSGMYTLAAALTVIQGFGMLVVFSYSAIALGLYTMAFGAAVILYDLKSVIHGVSIEAYFPFLGNYIGRALTIFYFAVLCAQAHEFGGWTKFIVLYNLLVATLQGFVYFTTKTVSSLQPHMEDLPDM